MDRTDLTPKPPLSARLLLAARRAGFTDDELDEVCRGPLLNDLRSLFHRRATLTFPAIDCDADPCVPLGLRLQRHQKQGTVTWNASRVSLWLVDQQLVHETWTKGRVIQQELLGKNVLNANVLDFLLARQHYIPSEWKGGGNIRGLFFWGTIYLTEENEPFVRCMVWEHHLNIWRDGGLTLEDSFGYPNPAIVLNCR